MKKSNKINTIYYKPYQYGYIGSIGSAAINPYPKEVFIVEDPLHLLDLANDLYPKEVFRIEPLFKEVTPTHYG